MFRRGLPVHPLILGVVVIAVSFSALTFAFVSHKGLPGRDYRYITAAFERVPPGMRAGADVRVRGQRVGQVHTISFEEGEPRVELQLPRGLEVHGDASVRIRSRSLLGQKYVQIDPGTAAAGPLEGVIAKDRTHTVVDIVDVVDTLDAPTREALRTAVSQLGAGFGGRGEDLNDLLAASPDLLADTETNSRTLTAEETRLVAFLVAAERLSGRFAGRQDDLDRLMDQMGKTLAALAVDGGQPVGDAVHRLPGTLDALTPALRDLEAAAATLGPAVTDLAPGAAALGSVTPDLRALFREALAPFGKVPGVNQQAVPALSALAATFNDARPLAPALRRAITSSATQLDLFSPYAADFDLLFDRLAEAFSEGDANGGWLRVAVVFGAVNQAGNRNPYPEPGEALGDGARYQP